jgi:hypothetical protein
LKSILLKGKKAKGDAAIGFFSRASHRKIP